MTPYVKAAIVILVIGFCCGCANTSEPRADEEAMMLYRDCMSGSPPPRDSSDVSAGLNSEHVASANAGSDNRRESRHHNECVKRANG